MSRRTVEKQTQVAVIGGGASGLAAAAAAAAAGAFVMVLEKEERVGRKLLATGNGRCNYSNRYVDIKDYRSRDLDKAEKILSRIGQKETLAFFERLGIWPRADESGRIYPSSEQAAAVLDVLRMELRRLGVEIFCGWPVKELKKDPKGGFRIIGQKGEEKKADRVIIACGGMAGAQYGCSGDGYALARAFGHQIIKPLPALVQLSAKGDFFRHLKGVRAKGRVCLEWEGTVVAEQSGEIQFTQWGLSGICIFDLSGQAMELLDQGKDCGICIDLFPQIQPEAFYSRILSRLSVSGHKSAEEFLEGMIHKKLIGVVLRACGVESPAVPASELGEKRIHAIAAMLKGWRIPVTGARPWSEAQTTSGGVRLSQIDPGTMESLLQKGLYFAGEVLDAQGRCGGYNLQWAWSTGLLAGRSAAGL